MQLVATTTPGLEELAIDEINEQTGAEATIHHQGAVQFQAPPVAVSVLNQRARTLNRVLLVLQTARVTDLEEIYAVTRTVPVEPYLQPGEPFAVRSSRHGEHSFTSPAVADRVGQAIVDRTAEQFTHRLPVDLDTPTYVFRAYVRDDRFVLALDTTGQRSLHRRHWRHCEHDAPVRPTIAGAMLRAVEYTPTDTVVDPMCGSGTIPIEAGRVATRASLGEQRSFAYDALAIEIPSPPPRPPPHEPAPIVGSDRQRKWVRCGRENARSGAVDGTVDFVQADAAQLAVSADVVAVNPPFGIRTQTAARAAHAALTETLTAGSWSRFVAVTTTPAQLGITPTEQIPFRFGRLDATLVVVRRH